MYKSTNPNLSPTLKPYEAVGNKEFVPSDICLSKADTDETQTINEDEKLPTDEIVETIVPEKKDAKDGEEVKDEKMQKKKHWN